MKKQLLAIISAGLISGCAVQPEALQPKDIDQRVTKIMQQLHGQQEAVTQSISLYEAMARAIKYNLDYKVETMELALRNSELKQARYDQFPSLIANAAYSERNKYSGASSSALLGPKRIGAQSLVASTSSELEVLSSDLSISWDVLDFGLSYIRAKQKGDEVLIANERKRKVINRIIEDVRTAYWRAVSAQRLVKELEALEEDVNIALQLSNEAFERRNTEPLSALTYQRELLKIKEEIQKIEGEIVVSKAQLSALMNLKPGTEFELQMPAREDSVPLLDSSPEQLVDIALRNRPELMEAAYQERINQREAKTALLDLLPSLRAYGGFNYDSNEFLFNNNWNHWGAQASWNLLEAFRYSAKKRTLAAQKALLEQRTLAITMAVLTQTHISRTRYEHARRRVETVSRYHDVQSRILDQIGASYSAKRVSRQTFIRERMNNILAEAKYDIALADLQNAFANIYASIGIAPFGQDISMDDDINEMADKLQTHWQRRHEWLQKTHATATPAVQQGKPSQDGEA
jgi:outer membrane protein TolC